jgi:hypothetical protein
MNHGKNVISEEIFMSVNVLSKYLKKSGYNSGF